MSQQSSNEARHTRHMRIRSRVIGTAQIPRMSIYRAHRNMFAQLIDDYEGRTLLSESTLSKGFQKELKYGGNTKAAALLGEMVAEKALKKGLKRIVFDRGGFRFHGRVKAFAEGARKKGLEF
jgi:large subunit ribosomal protein L18